jgi:hypothetical protein
MLLAVSASADKADVTQYWSSAVLNPDGGDVDYCLTTTALTNGSQTHSGSITANCDAEGELVTNTLASMVSTPTSAPNHGRLTSAVARGILIQVDDADGSGLSVDVTLTGWTASGFVKTETLAGLTDTTGAGIYTAYFSSGGFTALSVITTVTSGQGAGDDITVGYGGALIQPSYRFIGGLRVEAIGGTNASILNINGLPVFTEGGGATANYTDQLVLEPSGAPTAASRSLSTHNVKSDAIAVMLDVVGAANAGETVYLEMLLYDK